MSSTIPTKVYYVEKESTKEIRRFNLEADVAGNFEYLLGKIRRAFPDLLRKDLKVFWKDEENDYLTISSDEELHNALDALNISEGTLKFFVKVFNEEKNGNQQQEHPGITCDGCDSKIRGIRYKCTQCFDFDLCSTCEDKKVHPSEHEMISIKVPRMGGHYFRHPGFFRGGCRARSSPFRRRHPFGGPMPTRCGEKNQGSNECPKEEMNETIKQIAQAFGLDPDVANYYFVSFCDDLKKSQQSEDKSSEEPKTNKTPEDEKKEEISTTADDDDVDFETESKVKSDKQDEGDVNMESEESQLKPSPKEENKTETQFDDMVGHFAKQFGLTQEAQQHIQTGLGDLLQGIFNPQSSSIPKEKDEKKPEDFIFVDESKQQESNISEEEKFQQRLDKALKQMESMGFDNDGGWLSQLLVSKDLSIGRVLDALNPST